MDGSFRILVVEDDPGHALLVERTLRRAGVQNEIRRFDGGAELFAFLAETHDPEHPDLVLLDLRLPVMNGVEALRALRADPKLAGLHVLVLSTTLDPAEEEACHALGCDGFLLKPLSAETFLEATRRLGLVPRMGDRT